MKNLFTLLSHLRGSMGNLQSSDAICDRRSTVVRPSGLEDKLQLNTFVRFAATLVLVLTIGVGNMWGAETSFTFTPTSTSAGTTSGTVPDGVTCSYSNTYTNKNQCTKNNSISFSTSGMSSLSITKIVVSLSKSKNGTGTSTIKIGTSTIGTRTTYTQNTSSGTEYTFNNTEEATGEVSVSVSATESSLYFWYVKVYYDPDAGGTPTCATPTFSPAAGSYIGTQSVTISSTTTGSTIYYTTDGSTPTTGSAHGTAGDASATVSVSSSMTLNAIAVKAGADNSTVGTATYSIVSCSGDNFDWNLATNSYTTGTNEVTWSHTYATMHNAGTNATNYLGGDANNRTSSRFYSENTLTITPATGVTISHVVFTATTDGYAGVLRNSTWSNATASGSGTYVIVTPTDGTSAFSATVGATCGFTNVNVCYSACSTLGSIDGSINLTQGGTSVTIKDWSAVSYAGSYTVKMYHYNTGTSKWDLVSGTSSSTSGSEGTKTGVTDISTGVTFTGLTLNDDYKFSVQAIAGSSAYCDGVETAVTEINSTDVSSTPFKLSYSIYMDNGSGSGWTDHLLDDDGTFSTTLSAGISYYQFGIRRGFDHGGWWAATSADNVYNIGGAEWTLNGSNNVRLQTFVGGTYTFTVDLSGTNPKVTISYPSATQDAGNIVYWDASIVSNWEHLYFRVGTDAGANASADCKVDGNIVPGTDRFYKVTTASFTNMRVWAIANKEGWTGSNTNGVYKTNTGDTHAITKSTEYQDYAVDEGGVTLVPSSSTGTIGSQSHDNNCYFYPVTKTDGMLTHNVAVGAKPTGGSITVTYTNTTGTSGQTVTDGNNADLAHRCILNVEATPETGYNLATFTKNASAFAGGNYILTEDVAFAATFSLKQTTVTLNNHEATTAGATSVTATYSQAVPSIAANLPARTGYVFGGYWTGEDGTGTKYINADGTSANNWNIVDATTTLHAQWTAKTTNVTLTAGTGNDGSASIDFDAIGYTSFSAAVRVGWTCTGYWTNTGGTGTKILNADGTRADNVAGWWVSNKWSVDNTSATLYAGWTNTYGGDEFELVLDLSELSAGKKIVILDKDYATALSTTQQTNNRASVAASADGGFTMSDDKNVATLKAATSVQVMTLEATGTANQYYLNVENGYLFAAGENTNYYLKTRANNSSDPTFGQFLFTLSNGDFTIQGQGANKNGYLRKNTSSALFSCYANAGDQKAVLVYVKRESCDEPANALSLLASPTAISTATGFNTSTLSTTGGNGGTVYYRVISSNKANATIDGTTFSATTAETYTVQAYQLKNDNICRQIATTDITVTTPVLTTSKNSHTFEKTKTGSSRTTNTVTISGTNLVENVSVTYTGDTEYFTVTPSSISASDAMSSAQALTITYAPTVAGSHSITITISSTGAVDKTVTVNGTAADFFDVTFHISGSADVVRQVESGEKPVLPDNPASCDDESTTFIGWTTAPWGGKIASVSDKTIHTSNATMSAVTAATDYYAVWAKEDASADVANAWAVINEDFASASSGNNTTSSGSGTAWTKTSYFDATNFAYQAGDAVRIGSKENAGFIQTNAIPAAAGAKIRIAFKVKGWSDVEGSIKVTSDDAQFSEQTISYTATMSGSFESKYVDVTVAAGKSNPKINIATSAKRAFIDDVVISVYYSDYLTTCCENTGLTFGTISNPVTSYEIVRTSSAAATIDCNFESSTTTEIKWYKTSRAARTFVTPTRATSSTAPNDQLAEMTINNKKLTASSVGVYTITIKQDEATIDGQKYCESFAEVTVTVKVRDRFVDMMNGAAVGVGGNPTITRDDTGGGIYTPTESEFDVNNICKSTRRKLIGWIKESDLTSEYAGRVNDITDLKTNDPATNKVIAPNTQVVATGCTWYAVWADID